jgi:hypothetical protein
VLRCGTREKQFPDKEASCQTQNLIAAFGAQTLVAFLPRKLLLKTQAIQRSDGAGLTAAGSCRRRLNSRWNFGTVEPLDWLEDAMDTEKTEQEKKPIVERMTDLAAQAAGTLAETAVKSIAKRAKKAVAKRVPASVKSGTRSVTTAQKRSPKRGLKKAAATKKTAKKRSTGRPKRANKKSKR